MLNCGNYVICVHGVEITEKNLLSRTFGKNFVKVMVLIKKEITKELVWRQIFIGERVNSSWKKKHWVNKYFVKTSSYLQISVFTNFLFNAHFFFFKEKSIFLYVSDFKRKSMFEHITFLWNSYLELQHRTVKKTRWKIGAETAEKMAFVLQSVNLTQFFPRYFTIEDFFLQTIKVLLTYFIYSSTPW